MSSREEFLATVRQALQRSPGHRPEPPKASGLSLGLEEIRARVAAVKESAKDQADPLMDRLEQTAERAGWRVVRVATHREAGSYVQSLAHDLEARLIMRSAHPVLEKLALEELLFDAGIAIRVMALGDEQDDTIINQRRLELREQVIQADLGVTGVDYALADTGTCVLAPRKGVSRLVSLLPPVHVAVVEKGQVLETVDDLLAIQRLEYLEKGDIGSYMSLISGPSRTGDIEQTITVGIHGPKEVHLVLIGE